MAAFNPQPKKGMPEKKKPKPLKRSPIKRKYKPTGEKYTFEEVLDDIPYDGPTRCFVCGIKIAIVTHNNFAHILSKKKISSVQKCTGQHKANVPLSNSKDQ